MPDFETENQDSPILLVTDGQRLIAFDGESARVLREEPISSLTYWPIFENAEVVLPTCDTENPKVCESCQ